MIRANPRLAFQTFGKRYIFLGPSDYFLEVGRGEAKFRWTLTEAEFERVSSEQRKRAFFIGHAGYPAKYYWWYKDEILVCDEKFNAQIMKGWRVKREQLRSKCLQKYQELATPASKRTIGKAQSKSRKDKSADAAKALGALGYNKKEASWAVGKILFQAPQLTTEDIVKGALKLLRYESR